MAPPGEEATEAGDSHRSASHRWRAALAAGAALALLEVGLLLAVRVWVTQRVAWPGSGSPLSAWEVAFAALLGVPAALTLLLEGWATRRWTQSWTRDALVGVGAAALASLLLVMAWLQVDYAFAVLGRGGSPGQGVAAQGAGALRLWAAPETWPVLWGFGPAFGLCAWTRLRGWPLRAQVAVTWAGALVLHWLSLRGYEGLPQVPWVVTTRWCTPLLGTFVLLQPWPLGLALPLLGRLSQRVS